MLLLLLCLRHLRGTLRCHIHTHSVTVVRPKQNQLYYIFYFTIFFTLFVFFSSYSTHTNERYASITHSYSYNSTLHPCNGHGWQWRHAGKSDRQPVFISATRAFMALCKSVEHPCNKSGEKLSGSQPWLNYRNTHF